MPAILQEKPVDNPKYISTSFPLAKAILELLF